MQSTQTKRYLYSAYAGSLGAIVDHPVKAFLSDVPSAALPVIGGLFSQRREDLHFKVESREILRVGLASATVQGDYCDGSFVTVATSTVEKLNILDVITADAVVARSTSVYPGNHAQGDADSEYHKASFYFSGSHFENLRIDGKLYDCRIHPDLQPEEGCRLKIAEARHCSLFADTCREICIPRFGKIYLGELDMYSSQSILTMVRVETDCPTKVRAIICHAKTNGKPVP